MNENRRAEEMGGEAGGRERKGLRGEVDLAVKSAFEDYVRRDNRARLKRGERLPPGEQKGAAYATEELICWFLSLSNADRERVRRDGRRLREEVAALDPEDEGLPYEQNEGGVFCGEDSVGGGGDDGIVPGQDTPPKRRPRKPDEPGSPGRRRFGSEHLTP